MEAYTGFAQVYDIFMDATPYEEWCENIVKILEKYRQPGGTDAAGHSAGVACCGAAHETRESGVGNNYSIETDDNVIKQNLYQEHNTILDLGCGTGTLTQLLAGRGYEMIGIDNAQEMLQIAMEKRDASRFDILYLLQDMREFELYGTVGAVVCVCDSINYLLKEEEIVQTFRLVNNYLFPGGVFLFDFNTVYKYETILGDTTIAENREDCSFIWDNYYHEAEEINEYDLTIFVKANAGNTGDTAVTGADRKQEEGGSYQKFHETHYQRGYRLEQMLDFLERAGMVFLEAVDADTQEAVSDVSERIYVAARKGD